MSDLRTRIAVIADIHCYQGGDHCDRCECGHEGPWHLHLADAVIRELALREEVDPYALPLIRRRFVTEWKADDE